MRTQPAAAPTCPHCGYAGPNLRGFEPCPRCGRIYEPPEGVADVDPPLRFVWSRPRLTRSGLWSWLTLFAVAAALAYAEGRLPPGLRWLTHKPVMLIPAVILLLVLAVSKRTRAGTATRRGVNRTL